MAHSNMINFVFRKFFQEWLELLTTEVQTQRLVVCRHGCQLLKRNKFLDLADDL